LANAQLVPSGRRAERPRRSPSTFAREFIETIVLTAIVFLVVNITARPYTVDGPSMQPGLVTGDRVVVSMLAYDFGASPQRGDVIVFHPPDDPSATYVKRVIGIPGDRISITPDAVILNGHKLSEPYISTVNPSAPENISVLPTITLGPNQYFVMGDNRQDSVDSRVFGYVPRSNIIGKAEFVYWPLPTVHGISTYSNVYSGAGQ